MSRFKQFLSVFLMVAVCSVGVAEEWKLLDRTRAVWDGQILHAIDDEGVFMAVDGPGHGPMPKPNRSMQEILVRRGTSSPVRCRLVDTVDCTAQDTHSFEDDGGSRVLELPGGTFRVTAAPHGFELKWFRYQIKTANKAGVAHLVVMETPNDLERYTTVTPG